MLQIKLFSQYISGAKTSGRECFRAFHRILLCRALPLLLGGGLLLGTSLDAGAVSEEGEARLAAHRAMAVQSNEISGWPTGPVVGAESAILMEAETGTILYSKNIHQKQYPASTTKLLTTILATENCQLNEMVKFSHDAVFDTPRNSSHIAMDVGQALTVEQCLQAILIRSANEVSYAIAEHISGTTDWSVFAQTMNERAKELGCLNSNFVNPNGLPDDNHYTTAYDLAMIGREFFANEMLCKITLSRRLELPASDTLPQQKLELNAMKIIPTGEYAYEYLIGCKTGYTDSARSCLVSAAEKNGMRLICVVLHDESPNQYEDTIALFDYGFSNFEKVFVSQADTEYNIDTTGSFYSENNIFGSSKPLLSLSEDDFIILPHNIELKDVDSEISYDSPGEGLAALITYSYRDVALGTVGVNFCMEAEETYTFEAMPTAKPSDSKVPAKEDTSVIMVNIIKILVGLAVVAAILFVVLVAKAILRNYHFTGRKTRRNFRNLDRTQYNQYNKRRRRPKRPNRFRDYDF